jgi:arylsulfatase A-like enzyme
MVFDRAIATSSWSLPSHASMFTGRQAEELNANWETPLDSRMPTLAEVLGSRGYRTVGFVGNVVLCSYESGLTRGFQWYEDYRVSWGTLAYSTAMGRVVIDDPRFRRLVGWYEAPWRKPAPGLTASLLHWIDGHRDRPFFGFVNYFDAHNPYLADRFGAGGVRQDPLVGSETNWTPEGIAAERVAYEASIAAIDASLDGLFAGLERRGLRDNTLVILTSDHGEEFLEHGQMLHGSNLFMTSVHVPLVLLWPGRIPAGRRIAQAVSLRRIAATVEDLAGLGTTVLPGGSLRPVWDSSVSNSRAERWIVSTLRRRPGFPPTWPVSLGDQIALTGDTLQVLREGRDSLQIYNTAVDPAELNPHSGFPAPLRGEADSMFRLVRGRDIGATRN